MDLDLTWVNVAASLTLVAAVVVLSAWLRLGITRGVVVAAARAAVQLSVVGGVLIVVLRPEAALVWSWLWVAAMVVLATGVVRRRTRRLKPFQPSTILIVTAVLVPLSVCLAVTFGLGVFDLTPTALVPVAGILLGNSLPTTIAAAARIEELLSDERGQIDAMLALGFDGSSAIRPQVRKAIRSALVPQVERTSVVGLVALPGAMTGMILAGADPLDAVAAQMIVMFLILGGVAFTVAVVVLGTARRVMTPDGRVARPLYAQAVPDGSSANPRSRRANLVRRWRLDVFARAGRDSGR
ncbi:ABC transporter permease [Candidatus Poriferisodalis sp.]|uniref:ABC transporter permease n=1 Tax=Candidatus Poriferisodalis sp. TaxID=3101277 RepID=UPI003C6F2C97